MFTQFLVLIMSEFELQFHIYYVMSYQLAKLTEILLNLLLKSLLYIHSNINKSIFKLVLEHQSFKINYLLALITIKLKFN